MAVLDACALMAYLEREPGYERVRDFLANAGSTGKNLLMTTVNWGEVYYILARHHTESEREAALQLIFTLPIDFIAPDIELAGAAATVKSKYGLPYVDCFAAALSKLSKIGLLTADKDFKAVEKDIEVVWL